MTATAGVGQRHIPALAFPALVGANVTLAFGPTLVRLADVGPVAAGFWRQMIALPVLILLALWRDRGTGSALRGLGPTTWLLLAGAGIFFAADLAAWHHGIMRTKLANATLFANCSALIMPIIGALMLRQLPRPLHLAALALAFVGTGLMMGSSYELAPENLSGDLSSLLAGLFYAGYLLSILRVRRAMASWTALAAATAASVLPMLLFAWMAGDAIMPHNWTPLILLALSSQIVGQGLMTYALAYFSPLVVGLALLIQPMVAALIGWLRFGEAMTLTDALGAVAIAVALVLVRLPERKGA